MDNEKERVISVNIEDQVRSSYIDYAMSVIVGRALPDVRDGLKPVHRRIFYAMKELGLEHNKPYKKSARIVGDCLGKYHPHGDTAVYDALVRMAQDFSLRYTLIDGQGNFGSVDGDPAASMRYTEARLASIAGELLADIDKDTVDFTPNFDGSLTEPSILPSKLPNLLINGATGIAVGMATNIPPHNLTEILDAIIMLIENPETSISGLMKVVTGPDFPTGATISGEGEIKRAYETGRGLLTVSAKAGIEPLKGEREAIIITELPYQVNKANLIISIAGLVQSKKVEGISDIRDESDKEGMRIVVELKRGQNSQTILNRLYKHTQMKITFGVIMLALVDGRPTILSLKQVLSQHILHRKSVIRRRTRFLLARAEERAHILEGLKVALNHIDEVVRVIKRSKSVKDAEAALIKKFSLSSIQARAILAMQLARLTALERGKIEEEYLELIKKIEFYQSILGSEKKILNMIKEEAVELKERYSDPRRTEIIAKAIEDFRIEDLILEEDVAITISHAGYIKRLPVSSYRQQHRGGRGVTGIDMREGDFAERLFIASTHDYMLFFTSLGRIYWLKAHEIPQVGRAARGKAIVNLLHLSSGERVSSLLCVRGFSEGRFVVMVTRNGIIKKTALTAFAHPLNRGIAAITLREKDTLIGCELTDGKKDILLATKKGKAIRFSEEEIRSMGRTAAGVRGIRLDSSDEVVGMKAVDPNAYLLVVTGKGYGKRTPFEKYRHQSRGGKGVINLKATERNGEVVGVEAVTDEDELMLVTSSGMVVRCPVKQIRISSRATQGVRLIALKEDDRVVSGGRLISHEEKSEGEEKPLSARRKKPLKSESKPKPELKKESKEKGGAVAPRARQERKRQEQTGKPQKSKETKNT